jgi:hypothetical protein
MIHPGIRWGGRDVGTFGRRRERPLSAYALGEDLWAHSDA